MREWLRRLFRRQVPEPYKCPHKDPSGNQDRMCAKYGCPDDPAWKGDGCT